jgi:mono/diheme cytochrome c family protein
VVIAQALVKRSLYTQLSQAFACLQRTCAAQGGRAQSRDGPAAGAAAGAVSCITCHLCTPSGGSTAT